MSAYPSSPSTQKTSSSSRNVHPRRGSTNAIVSLAVLVAVTFVGAQSDPIATVSGGQVRGTLLNKGGAVFKGIPYAQPPVGDLRWREPSPVKPWTGVREAKTFGAVCAQRSGQIPNAAEFSSEDCLFVNIWTPEWPSRSRKPVMVWVYGGGNRAGGTIREEFDGESLARHGVLVVTLNYRVGSFGFFAHPELTRESLHRASGNQGLLDQIAALRWVRNNVTVFGGDPDNVTLFGESSGSLNVNVLMTSPLSKGLFRRVIGQSGTVVRPEPPLTLAEAEQRGKTLTARWPVPVRASIKDLRAVSTVDILQAEPTEQAPYLGISLDGYVVPKKPAQVFAAGQQHRVALILGSNAHERIPESTPSPDLKKAISEAYGPIAERAQALYAGNPDPDYRTPENQWATDTSFRCSAVAQLVWHAAARLTSTSSLASRQAEKNWDRLTHRSFLTCSGIWTGGLPAWGRRCDQRQWTLESRR